MENENLTPEQENTVQNTPSPLHTVTPLSKYLAMALFVVLPFIGGWIGYTYAPEKIVKVEKIVEVRKVPVSTEDWSLPPATQSDENTNAVNENISDENSYTLSSSPTIFGWNTYKSNRFDFEMSVPNSFEVYETNLNPSETVINFIEKELGVEIFVLPKGGGDYGLEEAEFTIDEMEINGNKETKTIATEGEGFYREFIQMSSSSVPSTWNNFNRIEVRISSPNELSDEILSTFKFIE